MRFCRKMGWVIVLGFILNVGAFAEFKFSAELGGVFNPSNIWADFRFGYLFPLKKMQSENNRDAGVFLFLADRIGVGLNDFQIGTDIDLLSFMQLSADVRLRTLYLANNSSFFWTSGVRESGNTTDVYFDLIYRGKVNFYFSKKIFYIDNEVSVLFHDMGLLNPTRSITSFQDLETGQVFRGNTGLLLKNQTSVKFRLRLLTIGVFNDVLYTPFSNEVSDILGGLLETRSQINEQLDFFFRLDIGAYVYDPRRNLQVYGRTHAGIEVSF